jgi:hypothetical protein
MVFLKFMANELTPLKISKESEGLFSQDSDSVEKTLTDCWKQIQDVCKGLRKIILLTIGIA